MMKAFKSVIKLPVREGKPKCRNGATGQQTYCNAGEQREEQKHSSVRSANIKTEG